MQTNLDLYILGEQSIDNLSSMQWANLDLESINGRKVKDISDDIQSLLNKERSKWGPFLDKAIYYATTTVAAGLAVAVIVELGLAWAGLVSITLISNNSVFMCMIISSGLSGLFYLRHQTNIINTRTKVHLETIGKWPSERQVLQNWTAKISNNQKTLKQLYERAKILLNSSGEDQKNIIETSIRKIELANGKVVAKIELLNRLPALSRYILLN